MWAASKAVPRAVAWAERKAALTAERTVVMKVVMRAALMAVEWVASMVD